MAVVVGVVFRNGSKTYHFDPAGLELARGDRVVVQTIKGHEIGRVVEPPHVVEDEEPAVPLKKVLRLATGEDLQSQAETESLRKEALAVCRELIAAHGLDMKLVDAEVAFGGDKITFSFCSDERVDFRALVADLARTLKVRVELRQIGAREEARLLGGLGPCGRDLCCSLFQGDEDPVSIRMAKEQNLPLNPTKISGLCGRLMCCLKYEQEQYVSFRKEAPPKGTQVKMGDAQGVIAGFNLPKEAVVVRFEDGSVADVRLDGCERGEDGALHCTRIEEQPKPVAPLLFSDLISGGEEGGEDWAGAASGQGEIEQESPKGAPSDGGSGAREQVEAQRKSRSRRSRNRRNRQQPRGETGSTMGAVAETTGEQKVPAAADGEALTGRDGGAVAGADGPRRRPKRKRSSGRGLAQKSDAANEVPAPDDARSGETGNDERAAAPRPRRRRPRRPKTRGTSPEQLAGQGVQQRKLQEQPRNSEEG